MGRITSGVLIGALVATLFYAGQNVADAGGGCPTYFQDLDGDGFGAGPGTSVCDPGPGYVTNNHDCDDSNGNINPGESEVCDANDTDEDCDAGADDADVGGAAGKTSWYDDADSDAYGAGSSEQRCDAGPGQVAFEGDCDDTDETVGPGFQEACDAKDNNCDGTADEGFFLGNACDNGGVGACNATGILTCDAGGEGVVCTAPTIDPTAETCDDADNDCDGEVDDGGVCAPEGPDLAPGTSPNLAFKCVTRNGRKTCKVKNLEVYNFGDVDITSSQSFVVTLYRSAADQTADPPKVWGKKTVTSGVDSVDFVSLTISVKGAKKPVAPVVFVDSGEVIEEADDDNNIDTLSFA